MEHFQNYTFVFQAAHTATKCDNSLQFIAYTNKSVSWKCCSPNVSFWTAVAAAPAWFFGINTDTDEGLRHCGSKPF